MNLELYKSNLEEKKSYVLLLSIIFYMKQKIPISLKGFSNFTIQCTFIYGMVTYIKNKRNVIHVIL